MYFLFPLICYVVTIDKRGQKVYNKAKYDITVTFCEPYHIRHNGEILFS